MQTYQVYDPSGVREHLLPITYTRPVGAIRVGIDTMADRWKAFLPGSYGWVTESYLQELFPEAEGQNAVFLAGNVVATAEIADAVGKLSPGEGLRKGDTEIAHCGNVVEKWTEFADEVIAMQHVYDIFGLNGQVLALDFARLTAGRKSQEIDPSNIVLGDRNLIFIEEGAIVEASTLNTRQGPIYIGRKAMIMEGCHVRGPLALCPEAIAKMGTLIYGATTVGPYCKVGGELNNVVMLGFANKGHDGFLGNAVIGEWCNLGGGTVASNLKNDYSEIKLWNYPAHRFVRTGLQFCGLIMGDHSKSAINTSFNTATTVGVGCNIVSEGMPRVFIPSFLKGGTAGFDNVNLNEFFTIAARVMSRRGIELSEPYKRMCHAIFDFADKFK